MAATIPTPVDVVAVIPPEVNIAPKPKYGVVHGPETVAWQAFPASSVSTGSIQISANQPNRGTLVDRRVYLQVFANFAITGSVPGGAVPLLSFGTSDALRAFPITSCCNTMTMKIGGKSVSVGQMDQFWPYLMRYHNPIDQRDTDYSITPAMLDQFQEYSQGLASNRSPLAPYGANPAEMSRGGWTASQITALVNPAPVGAAPLVTATFSVTLQEPLLMSPFLFAKNDHEAAFIGVDQFNFSATFDSLARMWSRFNQVGGSVVDPTIAGHGVAVTFTGAQLLFRQMTPSALVAIPRSLAYSYFNPVLYQTQGPTAIVPGAATTLQSSVITLPGIPRRLYVWASEVFANQTFLTSDTMFAIDKVVVKWGTKTYLAEATPIDLYNIAVKNGVDLSWPQWSSFCGGMLCLEMGADIGLAVTESAGSEGKFQIQVALTCRNLNPSRTILPNLNIIGVQEGVIEIRDGTVFVNENPVTARDVMNARSVPGITYKKTESIYGGGIVGGDFFGDLWSGLKKGANVVSRIAEGVAPIAGLVPGLSPYASAIGKYAPIVRAVTGGKRGARKAPMRGGRALLRRLRGRGLFDEEASDPDSGDEGFAGGSAAGGAGSGSGSGSGDDDLDSRIAELMQLRDGGVGRRDEDE